MTVMVVEVTADMIATIAAAAALGVGMFVSTWSIHKALEGLRADMAKFECRLVARIRSFGSGFSAGNRENDSRFTRETDIKARIDGLRDETTAGFREVADRLTNVGDRLSKVEGAIEGVVWRARHPSHDTPKEGTA